MRRTFKGFFGPKHWEERWNEAAPSMIGGIPVEKGMCDEFVIRLREAIDQSIDSSRESHDEDAYRLKQAVLSQLKMNPWVIDINLKEKDIRKVSSFVVRQANTTTTTKTQ